MKRLIPIFSILLLISCEQKETEQAIKDKKELKQIIDSNKTANSLTEKPTNYDSEDLAFDSVISIGNNKMRIVKCSEDSYNQVVYNDGCIIDTSNLIRNKDGFSLKLKNPESMPVSFFDFYDLQRVDEMKKHVLKCTYNGPNFWFVEVHYYEGREYVLAGQISGETKTIIGHPYFTNDNSRVIATNVDLVAGYEINGFEIYSVVDNKLEKIVEKKLQNWGIKDVKWENNNKFYFKREYSVSEEFDYCFAELNY